MVTFQKIPESTFYHIRYSSFNTKRSKRANHQSRLKRKTQENWYAFRNTFCCAALRLSALTTVFWLYINLTKVEK